MLTVTSLTKSFTGKRAGKLRRRGARPGDSEHVLAVNDVSFQIEKGELFTLLGPSGCGKTTTLRSIAGLESPDAGMIALSDRVLFDDARNVNVPANDRRLGMVFQSYAIWPHMTVFKNVSFPLEVARRGSRLSRKQIAEQVGRALEATELSAFADRPATKLSGGQQQRLALARALVSEPALVLLDEPLSNLDAKLRETMRFELKRLQRDRGVTSIYVTHDQTEALALSNRIAVMRDGRIEQVGKPREIYGAPATRFVAEFVGVSNFVEAVVDSVDAEATSFKTADGVLWSTVVKDASVGTEVLLSIRPEAIKMASAPPTPTPRNLWGGQIVSRAFVGDAVDYLVAVGPREMRVRSDPNASISGTEKVSLWIDESSVVAVPRI